MTWVTVTQQATLVPGSSLPSLRYSFHAMGKSILSRSFAGILKAGQLTHIQWASDKLAVHVSFVTRYCFFVVGPTYHICPTCHISSGNHSLYLQTTAFGCNLGCNLKNATHLNELKAFSGKVPHLFPNLIPSPARRPRAISTLHCVHSLREVFICFLETHGRYTKHNYGGQDGPRQKNTEASRESSLSTFIKRQMPDVRRHALHVEERSDGSKIPRVPKRSRSRSRSRFRSR